MDKSPTNTELIYLIGCSFLSIGIGLYNMSLPSFFISIGISFITLCIFRGVDSIC